MFVLICVMLCLIYVHFYFRVVVSCLGHRRKWARGSVYKVYQNNAI